MILKRLKNKQSGGVVLFKKILGAIFDLKRYIDNKLTIIECDLHKVQSADKDILFKLNSLPSLTSAQKTIESQQRTIEQLTNALMDKYEHGLFVVSEDGKIPMVIRNGKKVTSELTTYFSIDWNIHEVPTLTMEQRPGTYHDMEV